MKNNADTLRRLLRYIYKYIPAIISEIILSAVYVVFSLFIPIICGNAVDCMTAGKTNFDSLVHCLVEISVCALICTVSQWLMNTMSNKITYSVIRDVRRDAFNTLTRLPLAYIDSHRHGKTVSMIITDTDRFADGLILGFNEFFSGIVSIICTLVFMLTINPLITLLVVILTPLSLITASFIAKHTHDMFIKRSELTAELTGQINEVIGNQMTVRAYSKENDMLSQFDSMNGDLEKASLRAVFYSSLTNPSTRFVNNIVYASVCLTGALCVIAGTMTAGGLTSLLAYANQYTKPFNEISSVITELQNALASAERIFGFIDEPVINDDSSLIKASEIQGRIVFDNVEFSYTPDRELIKNFCLEVKPGERAAIVGPTGCGKTTLINLLMRFYDIKSGEIAIDGYNIESLQRSSLRSEFGMVLQDTWIKHASVRENITMGRDASDEEVIAAARSAHADSFISRLTDGYNTVISDEGGQLSAGQRQLLCIARIMLRIPPVLILDEATSSIDTRTEMKIQSAFAEMMKGRTSYIVAHRLTTVRDADVIIVMKDGNIVETGKHDELLANGGFYSELWKAGHV